MWRRLPCQPLFPKPFSTTSSSTTEIPTLYSFLQPSIFPLPPKPKPPSSQNPNPPPPSPPSRPQTLTLDLQSTLLSSLNSSLQSLRTDQAWHSFKTLASYSLLPPPSLSNSLILHLSSHSHRLNLKRALASTLFLLSKSPHSLSLQTLSSLFNSLHSAGGAAPSLTLIKTLLQNRVFPPFPIWAPPLIPLSKRNCSFPAFLKVFELNCRIAIEEDVDSMKPDLGSCNEVLDGCCRDLGSVPDAERVVEIMSGLGVSPDSKSFGSLAFLYAWKGMETRVSELDRLVSFYGFEDRMVIFENLIGGYVKNRNFELVCEVILRVVRECSDKDSKFLGEETYREVVKGFLDDGRIKDLATLIIEAQELESEKTAGIEKSVGFGVIHACVELGLLNKAHSVLDEMNARGASVGLGVYSSILKAYCKEQRTAEAAQLVTEISAAGLKLDPGSYDALIDSSMSAQDFQSAFSLFREMREARLPELKMSYLTIMTGLTENHRPELMASFLDSVVDDPRIEIATHDWNSIIHAFCKAGRLEDARRTYRRMVFLRFEPNSQTYLSLINGYVASEKYFSVLLLWTEVRRKGIEFDHNMIDSFLYALVKGGFFDAAMQVVEKAQELKIFLDKWRHKQAFMEKHKKLKVTKLRKRNFRKVEALIAFKNWAGLNA